MRDVSSDNSVSKKEQQPYIEEHDMLDVSNSMNDLAAHSAHMMSSLK